MINKLLIFIFAFYLSKLNTATASYQLNDGLVETKFFVRNCRVNNCTEALDSCVLDRCNTVSQCQSCMDRNHPECSECSRDIFENQPEVIGDKEFQLCDTEDELQVAACRYYCRGVFRQNGECVPYLNNLDVCDCSSNTVTTTQGPIEPTSTRILATTKSESGELIRTFGQKIAEITCLELLANGNVAAGYKNGLIRIWNPSTGESVRSYIRHNDAVLDLQLLSNGYLVSTSEDKTIIIWDVEKISPVEIIYSTSVATALETLLNGTLVVGTDAGYVRFYDDKYEILSSFDAHVTRIGVDKIGDLQTLPNGYLATCSFSNRDNIKIWDVNNVVRKISESTLTNIVTSLDIIGNGDLVSGSWDDSVRSWDPLDGSRKSSVAVGYDINSIKYLNNNKIAVAGKRSFITIINSNEWSQIGTLQSDSRELVTSIELLSNGNLISGSRDGILRVWRI